MTGECQSLNRRTFGRVKGPNSSRGNSGYLSIFPHWTLDSFFASWIISTLSIWTQLNIAPCCEDILEV
jgi:hypothetical protein